MFWNMASSLKNMVTKRLAKKPSASSQKEEQPSSRLDESAIKHQANFEARLDDEINQAKHGEDGDDSTGQARQFDSFHDQLKQIRLSRDFLENNPHLADNPELLQGADTNAAA